MAEGISFAALPLYVSAALGSEQQQDICSKTFQSKFDFQLHPGVDYLITLKNLAFCTEYNTAYYTVYPICSNTFFSA